MSNKPDGGPAFPLPAHEVVYGPGYANLRVPAEYGMTLRDYFAGQVLAGLAGEGWAVTNEDATRAATRAARRAYSLADAMIAERSK